MFGTWWRLNRRKRKRKTRCAWGRDGKWESMWTLPLQLPFPFFTHTNNEIRVCFFRWIKLVVCDMQTRLKAIQLEKWKKWFHSVFCVSEICSFFILEKKWTFGHRIENILFFFFFSRMKKSIKYLYCVRIFRFSNRSDYQLNEIFGSYAFYLSHVILALIT